MLLQECTLATVHDPDKVGCSWTRTVRTRFNDGWRRNGDEDWRWSHDLLHSPPLSLLSPVSGFAQSAIAPADPTSSLHAGERWGKGRGGSVRNPADKWPRYIYPRVCTYNGQGRYLKLVTQLKEKGGGSDIKWILVLNRLLGIYLPAGRYCCFVMCPRPVLIRHPLSPLCQNFSQVAEDGASNLPWITGIGWHARGDNRV